MANTIKLQGIAGNKEGTKVNQLRIGNVLVWNYGMKSEIVDITPSKSGKTFILSLKSCQDGIIRERKMSAETLVVAENMEVVATLEAQEVIDEVEAAIKNRAHTHHSIYSEIGIALDGFATEKLAEYYIKICGTDSSLRYYLEQQIIANEINKIKYA